MVEKNDQDHKGVGHITTREHGYYNDREFYDFNHNVFRHNSVPLDFINIHEIIIAAHFSYSGNGPGLYRRYPC